MIGTLSAAAAVLLVVSGSAKVRAPKPAGRMLVHLLGRRIPRVSSLVRAIGSGEVGAGLLVLAAGGRLPLLLLAGGYLVFAAVALRLLVSDAGTIPCGCFGRADTPVGAAHVVLTLGCAALGFVAASGRVGAFGGVLNGGMIVMATGVLQVVLLAALGYLSLTSLPALSAARRLATDRPATDRPATDRLATDRLEEAR